ncbi:cytohesin-1-like [Clavelina lepadiformis]|uniref:Cytohesin-1 n=1 Tax=Clavelina lepadiformis TaxID=159417 RepID=A0ABP0GTS4_CLALP
MKMTEDVSYLDDADRELLREIWRRKTILLEEIQRLKDEIKDVDVEIEQMEEVEDRRANTEAKQLLTGCKKFNSDAKKGIKYLVEHSLVQNTPKDVAEFIFSREGLNKVAIGDYLGERHEFTLEVLKEFLQLHQFGGKNLDVSLRQFLWSFRLPGEAQKIDRMMEAFAARYCECNPGVFSNPDTCYVLSFAIIMLNTSLHNPSVKDKPSVERFIAMNRGINDGKDLPNQLLTMLYDSIKKEPFKIPEDDGNDLTSTFFNPDREGWLLKQGGRYKTWKRRWFILADNCLYYFEYTSDKEPKGIIPLENLQIREVTDQRKPNCFEMYLPEDAMVHTIKAAKTDSEGRVVEGKHTTYRMSAATPAEMEDWITSIRKSISQDPYYDMIAARKKKVGKANEANQS